MTDKLLVADLINGNEAAFRHLISEYKNNVFNTCYGFVHDKFEADDIAQEVFIEVYNSIKKFKGDSSLSTWIYRITVNKSLDSLRKAKRRHNNGFIQNSDENSGEIYSVADNKSMSPEEIIENNERIAALNSAIKKLPDNQQTAFILHKYEQLSYKEISKIMNTSLSGVESLIHRAKANLKKHLYHFYKNS